MTWDQFFHVVKNWKELMTAARRLERRDPEGAAIVRGWADGWAHLICETIPGPIDVAIRALRSAPRHGEKNSYKNFASWGRRVPPKSAQSQRGMAFRFWPMLDHFSSFLDEPPEDR